MKKIIAYQPTLNPIKNSSDQIYIQDAISKYDYTARDASDFPVFIVVMGKYMYIIRDMAEKHPLNYTSGQIHRKTPSSKFELIPIDFSGTGTTVYKSNEDWYDLRHCIMNIMELGDTYNIYMSNITDIQDDLRSLMVNSELYQDLIKDMKTPKEFIGSTFMVKEQGDDRIWYPVLQSPSYDTKITGGVLSEGGIVTILKLERRVLEGKFIFLTTMVEKTISIVATVKYNPPGIVHGESLPKCMLEIPLSHMAAWEKMVPPTKWVGKTIKKYNITANGSYIIFEDGTKGLI